MTIKPENSGKGEENPTNIKSGPTQQLTLEDELDTKAKFDFDSLLQPLGGFGKYQMINLAHIAVIIMLASITELLYVFTAAELNHRCLIPECETAENTTFHQTWLDKAIPLTDSGDYAFCLRHRKKPGGILCGLNESFTDEIVSCVTFVYETEEWTIAREDWGINCEGDRWMLTLIGSLNNAGEVIGSLYFGILSDRFGRTSVIITMSVVTAIVGTIQSFASSYFFFAALEFLETCVEGGLYTLPFVLALEIVEPSKRVLAGTLITCAYPVGEIIVALVQWLTYDWRTTLRIVRIPFLLVISFYFTLPESVRWMVSKGKQQAAVKVLKLIAKQNGTVLTKEAEEMVLAYKGNEEDLSFSQRNFELKALFKSKTMRLRFLAILFVWIANTFIFYGMNLNSVSINENKFFNFILTSLIEVVSYFSVFLLLDRVGRRAMQSASLFVCALGCLLFAFVPQGWYWAQLVLFLIGKYGIAISFVVVDVFTAELFPTSVRGTTISLSHMVGRIAAVAAPQTPLLSDIYKPMPLLLFSVLATIAGALAVTLPETLNIKLSDTIKEAELLGKKAPT